MTANSFPPVVLRNGVDIKDPLGIVLGFVKASWRFDVSDPSRSASFGEPDLNQAALRAVRQELASRGHGLTEVRILDLLIMSVAAGA